VSDGARLAALYQEMILDHYRRPRNKGTLEHATAEASMANPLCGDEIDVQLKGDSAKLEQVRFTGRGCSISQSSASMMTEIVRGKSAAEVEEIASRFAAMLSGDLEAAQDERLGQLRALAGVARFPARHRCATLAWEALLRAVRQPTIRHQ
jgi:nitrogen fixation NifU-like protein